MAIRVPNPTFAVDEELWFGDGDDAEAESRAAASLAGVGARIVGAKPFPIAARRLDELTRNPSTRIEQVVTVLESDPALSARLLRLVNSAGYGLKVRCTSVRHAAVLVGTRRLNQVATTAAILDLFDGSSGLGMELLEHAAVVGSLCRYLAVHQGLPHDELFTCGFLHDIGKLMLLDAERERYAALLQEFGQAPDQMHLAERRLFGFDHAVLGAHVLSAWNIPEPVPRVIAWHHSPARALQDTVLAAMVETLRLADLLAYVLPMEDARLAIEIVAAGDAARYLEISDVQLAAMWDDLCGLRERSRARSHGEPELDLIVPRAELGSLAPAAARNSRMSSAPRAQASRGPSRPLHEVPTHFPCAVCGKPSYGNVCAACGGQVCPEHQAGAHEWCTSCVREFTRFKKTARLSTLARAGAGLLVGSTLAVAVVSAAQVPSAGLESLVLAPLMVFALWAVVLPVAYRLWQKLAFLDGRRRGTPIDVLSVARPQSIAIQSLVPPEGLPTVGPPSQSKQPPAAGEGSLNTGPLSMAPASVAPPAQRSASLSALASGSGYPSSVPSVLAASLASAGPAPQSRVVSQPQVTVPLWSLQPSGLPSAIPVRDSELIPGCPSKSPEPPLALHTPPPESPAVSTQPSGAPPAPHSEVVPSLSRNSVLERTPGLRALQSISVPLATAPTMMQVPAEAEQTLRASVASALAAESSPPPPKVGTQPSTRGVWGLPSWRRPQQEVGFNAPLRHARGGSSGKSLCFAGLSGAGPRVSQRPAATAKPGSRESA